MNISLFTLAYPFSMF